MNSAPLAVFKIGDIEGPFDVLLDLVQEKQLDLTSVSLKSVTDDFLSYIQKNTLPPTVKGDFLVVAATLLLLKTRQLTPHLTEDEEEEIEQLTEQVRVYQLYKTQSEFLLWQFGKTPLFQARFWADPEQNNVSSLSLPEISLADIRNRFSDVIQHLPKPPNPRAHLTTRTRSLEECVSLFQKRLQRVHELVFQDSLKNESPQEIAVSFLAVLELAKAQEVILHQDNPFDKLEIKQKRS